MASDCLASKHPQNLFTPVPPLNPGTERPETTGFYKKGTYRGVALRLSSEASRGTCSPHAEPRESPSAPWTAQNRDRSRQGISGFIAEVRRPRVPGPAGHGGQLAWAQGCRIIDVLGVWGAPLPHTVLGWVLFPAFPGTGPRPAPDSGSRTGTSCLTSSRKSCELLLAQSQAWSSPHRTGRTCLVLLSLAWEVCLGES